MPNRAKRLRPNKKAARQPNQETESVEVGHELVPNDIEVASLDALLRTTDVATTSQPPLSPRQVMQLQRTIGNRATGQLLQRKRPPARMHTATHLRTADELGFSESSASASTAEAGLVQRAPTNGTVAADTDLREPKKTSFAADDHLTPVKKDASIVIESAPRMSRMGADGQPGGFQSWHKVLTISGVDVSADNIWVHSSAVRITPVTPAESVTPATPTPAPTPAPAQPASPSASHAPALGSGGTKAGSYLTKTGDSGALDKSLTRGGHLYSARGTAMAGMRADYMAEAGPGGFDKRALEASDDALSPGGIRQGVRAARGAVMSGARTAGSAVASGVRSGAEATRDALGGSGGSGGGSSVTSEMIKDSMLEVEKIQEVTMDQASSLVTQAKSFGALAADKVNSGGWIGKVASALTSLLGVVQNISPFLTFVKSIVGLID
jgi:hypothetical protein